MPNPQEWHLLSDHDLFAAEDSMSFDDILHRSTFVYRCDQCDRLHVFWSGLGDDNWTVYAPEQS